MKKEIIKLLKAKKDNLNLGKMLNYIQDIAYSTLNARSINDYIRAAKTDVKKCEGMDGLFINGQYFDWKEFEPKKYTMVDAYLDYFKESDLEVIKNAIE